MHGIPFPFFFKVDQNTLIWFTPEVMDCVQTDQTEQQRSRVRFNWTKQGWREHDLGGISSEMLPEEGIGSSFPQGHI